MAVPLCRSRVLYVGSAIPTVTKDGLQGIQQPLLERYPVNGSEVKGIDAWLSVWSNGILLEYIEGSAKSEGSFHPIQNLHYCAAVRFIEGGAEAERFIPLDSAFGHNSSHPPIFAAIFRRSTGVKVLECHAFICTSEQSANALVRSCFHSYADTAFLRIDDKLPNNKAIKNGSLNERADSPNSEQPTTDDNRDDIDWEERAIGQKTWQRRQKSADYDDMLSTESSVQHKKPLKRNKKNETQSEIFENNGMMMMPYNEPFRRRSGSHPDISQSRPFEPHFPFHHVPPHPMFMPPPPGSHYSRSRPMPHPMHFGPPPFHPSAMHRPPFFGRFGGRPMPPHPMFMHPQHFGKQPQFIHPMAHPMHFGPPQHPFYSPQPQRPAPTGPIIESIYDTYPRQRGAYEESIYMPNNNGTLPPNSTYKPGPYNSEHYEGFYESYKRPGKHNSDSDTTSVEDSQFWDNYEAGAYKTRPQNHRNGTPKMNGEKSPSPQKHPQTYGDSAQSKRSEGQSFVQHSTPKIETRQKRPRTPEVDYDKFGNVTVQENNRQAAVF